MGARKTVGNLGNVVGIRLDDEENELLESLAGEGRGARSRFAKRAYLIGVDVLSPAREAEIDRELEATLERIREKKKRLKKARRSLSARTESAPPSPNADGEAAP